MKVLIFFIGLILFISGIVNLIIGIGNAVALNPPYYGVIGIILAIVFIPLGLYLMKLSEALETQEFERKKQYEIAKREEKERRETEERKKQFLEQEKWRQEFSQPQQSKYCSLCGKKIETKDKFCTYCGAST